MFGGVFFLEKKENRDMMAQTINNHQIRVVICTVFFFFIKGMEKNEGAQKTRYKNPHSSFLFVFNYGWAIVLIRKNGKKSEKHRLQP